MVGRARGKWGDAETAALIQAWEPIYKRRRDGEDDPWVPARRLGRVRSSRCLVADDWRVVAAAVNAYRDAAHLGSHRTSQQCKGRFGTLAAICWKDSGAAAAPSSSRRFFTVLRGVLSPTGTGQPTGQPKPVHLHHQMETDEAARQEEEHVVVLDDGSAVNADNPSNVVEVEVEPPAVQQEDIGNGDTEVDTRGPVAEDGRADTAGYVRRSAAMAGLWGGAVDASRIPKRARSFGSTSGAANLRGEASADGFIRDSVADLLGSASAKGRSASVSAAAEVVMKVTAEMCHDVMAMCQNVMMKSLDAEKNTATRGNNEP